MRVIIKKGSITGNTLNINNFNPSIAPLTYGNGLIINNITKINKVVKIKNLLLLFTVDYMVKY